MTTEKRIRQLEYLAFRDDMTKLYNRHYLFMEVKLTDWIYLYFIDINGLKKVNESGHFTGDEHIRMIVRKIKNILGENDIFIRYAGDEFIVLSNDDDKLVSNDLYSVGKTKTNSKVRPTIKKANKNMLNNKKMEKEIKPKILAESVEEFQKVEEKLLSLPKSVYRQIEKADNYVGLTCFFKKKFSDRDSTTFLPKGTVRISDFGKNYDYYAAYFGDFLFKIPKDNIFNIVFVDND